MHYRYSTVVMYPAVPQFYYQNRFFIFRLIFPVLMNPLRVDHTGWQVQSIVRGQRLMRMKRKADALLYGKSQQQLYEKHTVT